MNEKEANIQLALGTARLCGRCKEIKLLSQFILMEGDAHSLPELTDWCAQCFREDVGFDRY